MLKKISLILMLAFLLAGCGAKASPAPEAMPESAANVPVQQPTTTSAPTETAQPEPTATLAPTETAIPEPTRDPNLFGFVSMADAPMGFMLEPIAQVIFEDEMQRRVDAGEFDGFQTEGLSIVPRGDGTFFAEIFYALQADASVWTEDFGTPADDGWVRGKCTRFDFEMVEEGYYLKNKAVCN